METVFGSVERKTVKTEVGEQQVVSSAPMLKQSAFTHSFIDQSITYILSFSFINPSSLVVLYKPNLSTYIRQVITSCERKPRSAQSIYSNCRTKNRETVIIKMVTTYWKHSNIMRDRVEKREDASSRMELTGLLHVYFKNG